MQREFAAPVDLVWRAVGEGFGEVGVWASGLESSYLETGEVGVGAVRVCKAAPRWPFGAAVIRERLLTYDPTSRTFSYEAFEGLPSFMAAGQNRWTLEPLGPGRTLVRMHGTLVFRGLGRLLEPLLRRAMRREGTQFLDDLGAHLESVYEVAA